MNKSDVANADQPNPTDFAEATRLKREHENGDRLAVFELCAYWQQRGLPYSTVPSWALNHLINISATYFEAGPFSHINPKKFRELSSKERQKYLPSLDATADLTGGRGKMGAWHDRAEKDRDPYVQAFLDDLKAKAIKDKQVFLKPQRGKRIPVFVEQGPNKGTFRSAALDEIARCFSVRGHGSESRAKTMRRRFRL